MRTIHARVQNKAIVVEDETLPEGAEVTIQVADENYFDIDDPELERELLLSIAEADAGDVITADELLRELRSRAK
ncbi:MAG TPA: hypothetical protein VMU84_20905 [Thermoanaerobaculia bacterium]|nr:hypothetical protein [Thermoanaerobaculia bacterium]